MNGLSREDSVPATGGGLQRTATYTLGKRISTNAWARRSVQSLFRETCHLRGSAPAIVYRGESISYQQLLALVDRLTERLLQAGIGAGDVVATLPAPTFDFAVSYFAILQTGATINPLNLMWEQDHLTAVLQRNRPQAIISVGRYNQRDYVALLGAALSSAKLRQSPKLLISDSNIELPDGFTRLQDFIGEAPVADIDRIEQLVRQADPEQPQFICQTSGSTGYSKSAFWKHRSPLASAHFMASNLGLCSTDRYLNLSPFFHNSGICASLTMCLAYVGNTLYLQERFDPDAAVRTIQEDEIVGTFGFAAHWQAMRASHRFDPQRFGLRKVILAGDSKLHRFVEDMCADGATVANLYAQTENGPLVSLTEIGCVNPELRRSNNGRPLPGVELHVCDIETGAVLSDGQPGEIRYRSPYLFLGYLDEHGRAQLPLDEQGFFCSGDYGFLRDGYLTWIERLGGVVKSGGENVSLARVSAALAQLLADEFEHGHAVAVPDPYWGDRVVGIIHCDAGAAWDEVELRRRCKAVLAAYEVPRNFLSWNEAWPISAEGKLNTARMRNYAIGALAHEISERNDDSGTPSAQLHQAPD